MTMVTVTHTWLRFRDNGPKMFGNRKRGPDSRVNVLLTHPPTPTYADFVKSHDFIIWSHNNSSGR